MERMKTLNENFDNIKADCPSFAEPSGGPKEQQAIELPSNKTKEVPTDGGFPGWGYPIIILGVITVFLCVLGYWKRQGIQEFVHSRFCTPETPAGVEDRSKDGVSEISPMNGVSVDKPILNGTSTAVV